MSDKERIGILGGTFNPVHNGHLRIAEEVRETMGLKKIIFVPSYIPPHKSISGIADSHHRAEMVKLAIGGNPFFEMSLIEIRRGGKSFTIDTVNEFKKEYEENIYLISGIDTFEEFATWRHVDKLIRACNVIVTSRPGFGKENFENVLRKTITADFPEIKFSEQKKEGPVTVYGIDTSDYKFYSISSILLDISATKIRGLIKAGKSVKYLVPDEVEKYLTGEKIFL